MNGGGIFKLHFSGSGVPGTYIIDRNGNVASHYAGWADSDAEKMRLDIEALLQ